MSWQTERGYLRFGRNYYIKARTFKVKWQKEIVGITGGVHLGARGMLLC